jgi:hypothetical protein
VRGSQLWSEGEQERRALGNNCKFCFVSNSNKKCITLSSLTHGRTPAPRNSRSLLEPSC